MRKFAIAASVLGLLAGLVWLFTREDGGAVDQAEAARQPQGPEKPRGRGWELQPEAPEDQGVRGTAETGSTPRLAQPPTEEDGSLEVEVVNGERPVPGASLRLYWRGVRDPNLGAVSWRLASTGTTDGQGRARLASRPGAYLLSVRAQGLAPLLRDVVRPYGEARTSLKVRLEPGRALAGRTVVKGSGEVLPLVEVSLTAHGHAAESWEQVEAPAEEKAFTTSDARGLFRLEGLAPGTYELEAQAPGHARVQQRVQVPSPGELTVELPAASVVEGFVVDAQGQPVSGAEVQLGGRTAYTTTTGQGGGFSVEVVAGSYVVTARSGESAGALEGPVQVAQGRTVRGVQVRLGAGASIEGRVVARSSGAPVPGASVDISPLRKQGAALYGFAPDTQRYFDYHHAATDVFEAVNKRELELGAASMAVLIYLIDQHGLPMNRQVPPGN